MGKSVRSEPLLSSFHRIPSQHQAGPSSSPVTSDHRCGGLAQLGEHFLCKEGVSGSSPLASIPRRGAPQLPTRASLLLLPAIFLPPP